mgnify:CR=1 FL=1
MDRFNVSFRLGLGLARFVFPRLGLVLSGESYRIEFSTSCNRSTSEKGLVVNSSERSICLVKLALMSSNSRFIRLFSDLETSQVKNKPHIQYYTVAYLIVTQKVLCCSLFRQISYSPRTANNSSYEIFWKGFPLLIVQSDFLLIVFRDCAFL